jgi:hypothetical protein
VNNYKQALGILQEAAQQPAYFPADTDYEQWLEEEYLYLSSKKKTPPEEVWKMEYYTLLVRLVEAEYDISVFSAFPAH